MRTRLKTLTVNLFVLSMFCMSLAGANRALANISGQVNLVLPELGEVLIYKGADDGVAEGMVFDVIRDGQGVGQVTVTELFDKLCRARVTDTAPGREIRIGDTVRTAMDRPGPVERVRDPSPEEPAVEEKQEAAPEPAEEKQEEPAPRERPPRERAPREPDEPKPAEQPREKRPDTKPWRQFGYVVLPSSHGLSGILSMPTIDSRPRQSLVIKAGGIEMKDLHTNAYIVSGTYGVTDDLEVALGRINFDTNAAMRDEIMIYGVKYSFSVTSMYKDKLNRAAVGIQGYDSSSINSSRIFLVTGLDYEGGGLHLGVHQWSGDQSDIEDYDSLGYMVGWQRTFNRDFTLMLEFDSLSMIGKNSWSGGIRHHQRPLLNWEINLRDFNHSNARYFEAAASHTF